MKRLFALLLVTMACIVGLGFYLGWFHLSTDRTDQKTNITITVDPDRIRDDEEKAKEKVLEAGRKVKEETGTRAEKSKDDGTR